MAEIPERARATRNALTSMCIQGVCAHDDDECRCLQAITAALMAERAAQREIDAGIAEKIAADSREEAKARAAEKDYHTANHWNAHADGCDETAQAIREQKQ